MRTLVAALLMFFLIQTPYAHVQFLTISDIHYGSDNTPGDGHNTDNILFDSAINTFSKLAKRVQFIIALGDFPTNVLFYSPTKKDYLKKVFHGLYAADTGDKPMFFVSGNNDPIHGDYQPFSWNGKSLLDYATDWQGACVHCQGLVIDKTHMIDKGYYSSYVIPHNKDIVLIALNTTQFSKTPFFIPEYPNQQADALEQLSWLKRQLNTHHAKQLLIAMHIPPGNDYLGFSCWQPEYLALFIDLLSKASSRYGQITLLTSHTHMDEIRKISLAHKKTLYAFATPSISRSHHNNPGMKIFELNNHMMLKNYTTHYTITDSPWEQKQYRAMGDKESIFPECMRNTITQCLDALNKESLCDHFEKGLFFGVKSPRVDQKGCLLTYSVT